MAVPRKIAVRYLSGWFWVNAKLVGNYLEDHMQPSLLLKGIRFVLNAHTRSCTFKHSSFWS